MNNKNPTISVIISTYNNPGALRLVLIALNDQNSEDFEIIVADDGSDEETKKIIENIKNKINYDIKHVWQPHDGFRAAMIRNKGAACARGDYLIFLDGDSIPVISFIGNHKKLIERGYFVTGNRILLSSSFTRQILGCSIYIQQWSRWHWLHAFCRGWINRFLPMLLLDNSYWHYSCLTKWQGAKTCNLGVWKKDFIAVNGFDENYYGWGYEDSDFVIRLIRQGVFRKNSRFMIPVMHLWHPKNNRDNEHDNMRRLAETTRSLHIKAMRGVDQYIIY